MADMSAHAAAGRIPWRSLAGVIACISVVGLALGITLPLVSLVLERRGVSSTVIGAMAAMPAVAILLVAPFIPVTVRRYGGKLTLWVAVFAAAASILVLGFVDHLAVWFAMRFLMGVALTFLFVVSETWINQLAPEKHRGRLVALYASVLSACFAAGPMLLSLTGTEGAFPFMIGGAITAVAAAGLLLPPERGPELGGKGQFNILGFLMLAPTICAGVALVSYYDGMGLALIPVYGVRQGLSAETSAALITGFVLGSILYQLPIGWLADRFNRRLVLIGCGLTGMAGALLFPLLIHQPILLWPMLSIWGGAIFGIYTIAMTITGQRFRGGDLITANAAFGVLWGVGNLLGPSTGGLMMDIAGDQGLILVAAGSAGLFVLLAVVRGRTREHQRA